jgi:manganese transport system ATP-binding protein
MRMSSYCVAAKDLVLAYGASIALDSSSFALPRGKVTAVIGPNGSGKSTLLNAIAGLLEPIAGEIDLSLVGGSEPRIAFVLQTTKVNDALPVSVREVVTMGRYSGTGFYRRLSNEDREAVAEAMTRVGIVDIGDKHLQDLSGGQRQRVFVAQGLVQEHDILLLDEPLTGIDLPTAQAIDEVIHDELTRNCTVIMTTHDLSEAQIADNVLLLSGRVVAAGPPEEVLTADNLAQAYGASLLHVDEGRIFLDDAAHRPVEGRHVHRQRSIHTETSPTERHPDSE